MFLSRACTSWLVMKFLTRTCTFLIGPSIFVARTSTAWWFLACLLPGHVHFDGHNRFLARTSRVWQATRSFLPIHTQFTQFALSYTVLWYGMFVARDCFVWFLARECLIWQVMIAVWQGHAQYNRVQQVSCKGIHSETGHNWLLAKACIVWQIVSSQWMHSLTNYDRFLPGHT